MPPIVRFIRCTLPAIALAGVMAFASHTAVAAPAAGSFAEVGVPFVESHCVSCHGKEKQKANLALHTVRDDLALLRARKQWRGGGGGGEWGGTSPRGKTQRTDAVARGVGAAPDAR